MQNCLYKGLKVLYVSNDYLIASKGYIFYKYFFANKKWKKYAKVVDPLNSLFSLFPLTRRLTRAEISRYYKLCNGSELCIGRKGIFRKEVNGEKFIKTFNVLRGSRPMCLCEAINGDLYFGEYFQNIEKKAVHIYSSTDHGKTWNIVYTFPEGNINHVHGIYRDPYTQKIWIATGDRDNECIVGYSEDGFKTLREVFRGNQEYRTCFLFFYKDFIVFGTDSQYQKNELKKFDRRSLEITSLQQVQGPIIRGSQCGDFAIISTDVEPSEINKDKNAYVWYTKDGLHWEMLFSAKKDCFNPTLFQFGVFDLPYYAVDYVDKIYITGKAVKKHDGNTLVFDLNNKYASFK